MIWHMLICQVGSELNYRSIKLEILKLYIVALSAACRKGTGNVEVAFIADVDDIVC